MPVYFSHFKADHKSIAGFLLSGQLRDAVRQGAQDVAAIANRTAGITEVRGEYRVEAGPDVIVTRNGNPRLSERVVNAHRLAAADEFGTGTQAEGESGGAVRRKKQGGGSPANRTLGKAGAHVGDGFGTGE